MKIPDSTALSRRRLFTYLLSAGLSAGAEINRPSGQSSLPPENRLSPDDDRFLNDLEYANFLFFWEQSSPLTGLTRDRASISSRTQNVLASIAATGFGLTAVCIGQKRGYIDYAHARDRVALTLRSLLNWQPNHRGFFFHWVNIDTGERVLDSEVSSVDTAILLCGVLTCRAHFADDEITEYGH